VSTTDALLDRFQAAWSHHHPDAFADMCASDMHYEDPVTTKPLVGPAALADHARRLWTACPDARLATTGVRLTDGRFVAAPVKLIARHTGELNDFPASGRKVGLHAVFYCELDAERERLWRVRGFFDLYDAAVQLGVLPKPGSMGERALYLLRGFGLRG
jgi:steroid delta-isomerase-like uncharacterized protein